MYILINRFKITNKYSLGTCYIKDKCNNILFETPCIERGWQNNKKNISCVPEGKYPIKYEYSPRFNQKLWELKDVPNRAECKFHVANYWYELNGCIALGDKHIDINGDGDPDVTNSKKTLKRFEKVLKDITETTIYIENK